MGVVSRDSSVPVFSSSARERMVSRGKMNRK